MNANINNLSFFLSAMVNTIPAPYWKRVLVRLLGKRLVVTDDEYQVTFHKWRGAYYVTRCKELI